MTLVRKRRVCTSSKLKFESTELNATVNQRANFVLVLVGPIITEKGDRSRAVLLFSQAAEANST